MKYDLCIIGAGPAGYSGALIAAREGLKVALVEKDKPGGTCLNRGCIPTKALRRSADVLLETRQASRFGVKVAGETSLDFAGVAAHRDGAVKTLVDGVSSLLKARKITLVKGEAKIEKPGLVRVAGAEAAEIEAERIIIATGSSACDLPGLKIDEERIMSSEGALRLTELPRSLIVIGGGVIGCEFADIMRTFGAEVTVIEAMPRILLNEDKATAKAVQKALESRGVRFEIGTTIDEMTDSGELVCKLKNGAEVRAEKIIVSVGRRPALSGLGLEALGIETDKDAVKVDSRGKTNIPGIFAAGDAIGAPMLAHAASHEMEVVIDNLLGHSREFNHTLIPWVVYTRPEVASVGLLEDRAKEQGIPVDVGRMAYAANGKAQTMGETDGTAKVIVDKESGKILGATVIGAHAGDLIHEIAVAIKAGLAVKDFYDIIHAHPTLSELILETVLDAKGKAVHKVGRPRA